MHTVSIEKTDEKPLGDFPIGIICYVTKLTANGFIQRRLLDLGIIEGTKIEVLHRSPLGDPVAYQIRGTVIALRKEEAKQIWVKKLDLKGDIQ